MMDDLMQRIPRRIVSVVLHGLLVSVICSGILVPMLSAEAGSDNQSSLDDNRSHRSNV